MVFDRDTSKPAQDALDSHPTQATASAPDPEGTRREYWMEFMYMRTQEEDLTRFKLTEEIPHKF